jgi:hypothetical protein
MPITRYVKLLLHKLLSSLTDSSKFHIGLCHCYIFCECYHVQVLFILNCSYHNSLKTFVVHLPKLPVNLKKNFLEEKLYTVELGYNVIQGTEYFVSL